MVWFFSGWHLRVWEFPEVLGCVKEHFQIFRNASGLPVSVTFSLAAPLTLLCSLCLFASTSISLFSLIELLEKSGGEKEKVGGRQIWCRDHVSSPMTLQWSTPQICVILGEDWASQWNTEIRTPWFLTFGRLQMPWKLKKALDLLPRKVCGCLVTWFAEDTPWSPSLQSDAEPSFPLAFLRHGTHSVLVTVTFWDRAVVLRAWPPREANQNRVRTIPVQKGKPPFFPSLPPPRPALFQDLGFQGFQGMNSCLNRSPSTGIHS